MQDDDAEAWARDELVRLIGIPSPSGAEGEIVGYLDRRARELGFSTHLVETPDGAPNVVLGDSSRPALVIAAHVDTIVPQWETDYRARAEGHEVHGLGAVDDKGGVVACLLALVLLQAAGTELASLPAAVAFSVDEERGGTGSGALAEALRPRYAIALEGTDLRPATVECGYVGGWFDIEGVGAHGALPELGVNAVLRAGQLLAALERLEFTRCEHELAGPAAVVPFEIGGGSSLYAVPDFCRVRFGARLVPGVSSERARRELEEAARAHGAALVVDDTSEAFETPAGSWLPRRLTAETRAVTGRAPAPCSMAAWTDAHSFVDIAGSEAVVFGPGDLGTAHRPDERIDLREIVRCSRIFAGLLASLA